MSRSDLLIRSCTCKTVTPTSLDIANSQAMIHQTNILLMRKLNHWRPSMFRSMKKNILPFIHILLSNAICRYCPKYNKLFLTWNVPTRCYHHHHRQWAGSYESPGDLWLPFPLNPSSSAPLFQPGQMLSASLTWTRPAGTVWWHTLVQCGKRPLLPV